MRADVAGRRGLGDVESVSVRANYLFTSESVSEGHPDKVCDRISDEVVDAFYRAGAAEGLDPWGIRAACETLATTNRVVIAGEYRGPASVDEATIVDLTRRAIRDIGYEQDGFHWEKADIEVLLHGQSADIAQGVDAAGNKDEGAGDQGIMFGYACRETPELMPAPIYYSHKILKVLTDARKSGAEPKLGPDAKSQVTVRYEGGKPVAATQIVLSTQHLDPDLSSEDVRAIVEPYIRKAMPEGWITGDTVWHVNPTGKFVIGGPDGDTGLTGRKIIVDTYGGAAPHGGGAFSGKDPTKVDRSAAYAARYPRQERRRRRPRRALHDPAVLRHRRRQAALESMPTCTARRWMEPSWRRRSWRSWTCRPRGIRSHLDLNKPIYARTSAYGHFGREPDAEGGFSWERTDLADELKSALA